MKIVVTCFCCKILILVYNKKGSIAQKMFCTVAMKAFQRSILLVQILQYKHSCVFRN